MSEKLMDAVTCRACGGFVAGAVGPWAHTHQWENKLVAFRQDATLKIHEQIHEVPTKVPCKCDRK